MSCGVSAVATKRGDTLRITCVRTDVTGATVNLTGSGASKMRLRSDPTISHDLTYTVIDAVAGKFTISATPAETALWAVGAYECDVEFTDGADVYSTDTFTINVHQDVT